MMTCVDGAASIWLLGSWPRILDEGSLVRTGARPSLRLRGSASCTAGPGGLLDRLRGEAVEHAVNRPHEPDQLAGHRGDRDLRLLPPGQKLPIPLREPQLRLPD